MLSEPLLLPSPSFSTISSSSGHCVSSGTPGLSFGSGGSGGISGPIGFFPVGDFVTGGDGAPAYLKLTEYGDGNTKRVAFSQQQPSKKLTLLQVTSLGASLTTALYVPPHRTQYLEVHLWGSGGGGGGCSSLEPSSPVYQISGGGGAGGYARAWIQLRLSTDEKFEYFVSEGGKGGFTFSAGQNATTSWFSNPAHLYANSGTGGMVISKLRAQYGIAQGGFGGDAGGTLSTYKSVGNPGSSGICAIGSNNTTQAICTGGAGGAAALKSGQARMTSVKAGFAMPGSPGALYGGDGSGGCNIATSTQETPAAPGGDGADGHLLVLAYG